MKIKKAAIVSVIAIMSFSVLSFSGSKFTEVKANLSETTRLILNGKDTQKKILSYNNEIYVPLSVFQSTEDKTVLFDETNDKILIGNSGTETYMDANFLEARYLSNMKYTTNSQYTSIGNTKFKTAVIQNSQGSFQDFEVKLAFYQTNISSVGGYLYYKDSESNDSVIVTVYAASNNEELGRYNLTANTPLKFEINTKGYKDIVISQENENRNNKKINGLAYLDLYYKSNPEKPIDTNTLKVPKNGVLLTNSEIKFNASGDLLLSYDSNDLKWNNFNYSSCIITSKVLVPTAHDYSAKLLTGNFSKVGGVIYYDSTANRNSTIDVNILSSKGELIQKVTVKRGTPQPFLVDVSKYDDIIISQDDIDRGQVSITGLKIMNLYGIK